MDGQKIFLMQQTYATLFSVTNKVQVEGNKYLEGLTSRQLMTMLAIAHLQRDKSTINNIAGKLGTTKQSVKQLITILENKGYVIKVPSEIDKRAVNVRFTDSGKQVAQVSFEKGMQFFDDLFNEFNEGELETLWGLLKKLYRFDGKEQDGFEEKVKL